MKRVWLVPTLPRGNAYILTSNKTTIILRKGASQSGPQVDSGCHHRTYQQCTERHLPCITFVRVSCSGGRSGSGIVCGSSRWCTGRSCRSSSRPIGWSLCGAAYIIQKLNHTGNPVIMAAGAGCLTVIVITAACLNVIGGKV